jgi:predicted membrane-bound spermidine synthase
MRLAKLAVTGLRTDDRTNEVRSLPIGASGSSPFVAYVAFFLSGASSLIFQTIWTRMLHHVFGATSVAISTVLTVFMAGLGLGAWLGGRYANRIRHPIITYAIAEIGVGLFGLLIPLLVEADGWLATVNAMLRAALGADSGLFMVARFLCVAPILILPTTLMGSTLPLLTRHFVSLDQDARSAGARVGILYALNTFGAATGPILSAFVLLPNVGLSITNIVACGMNFTLAALILLARRMLLRGQWEPGQPLGFWPSRANEVAPTPPPAPAPAPDPVVDAAEEAPPAPEPPVPAEPEARAPKATKKKAKGRPSVEPTPPSAAPKKTRAQPRPAATSPGEAPIPELARKVAFLCFAASGAAALAYEVVWSRALAMTIGSSIYSFALILDTFLIGIAGGAAAMSAFLGGRARPYLGVAVTSCVLILLANVPWAIDIVDPENRDRQLRGDVVNFVVLSSLYIIPVILAALWAHLSLARDTARRSHDPFRDALDWRPLIVVLMAAMPVIAAGVNTLRYPGYLPQIILSVVSAVAVFLVVAALMHRAPTLLLAIVQLFIAGATVVSYVWQDEIPRAFAQLVVSIPQEALPDHVGTVKLFMFVTVVLCTLPATLGMGAMFPLTVRIWTSGGEKIASDVASVYTGNTVGSIIGSWLPGFVLFALIGAERTLHLGVALNMVLALLMLIAGVADPEEDRDFWSWRRLSAIGLPAVAALMLGASAVDVHTEDWRWWTRAGGAVGFGALAVLEYSWLRANFERGAASTVGWALVLVPLVGGIALSVVMVSPSETDPWALQAVYGALRTFVTGVGVWAAWANWREMSPPVAALASGRG